MTDIDIVAIFEAYCFVPRPKQTFLICFSISLRAEKLGIELFKIYKRVEPMSYFSN